MSDSLYGAPESPLVPAATKPPTLLEQIEGIFTAPKALFDRLHRAPSWVPALLLTMVLAILVTVAWGLKVDADAMLRPAMERNPNLSADQIDQAIQVSSKFILFGGLFFSLVGIPAFVLLGGLINWALGRGMGEPGANPPSYLHGLSAAVVPGLVRLPETLIILAICLLKPIGGHKPDQVAPTSLGYFIQTASPKLQALLYALNPFTVAGLVLTYLAMRHVVKARPAGAALVVGIYVAFMMLGVAFAR